MLHVVLCNLSEFSLTVDNPKQLPYFSIDNARVIYTKKV